MPSDGTGLLCQFILQGQVDCHYQSSENSSGKSIIQQQRSDYDDDDDGDL